MANSISSKQIAMCKTENLSTRLFLSVHFENNSFRVDLIREMDRRLSTISEYSFKRSQFQ